MLIKRQFLCIDEVGKDEKKYHSLKRFGQQYVHTRKEKNQKFQKFMNSAVYHIEKIEKAEMVNR